MSKYVAPTWMHPPSSDDWSLDEIKGGVIVNTYPLRNSLILFGRSPLSEFKSSAFITTAHESCSRLHARIAFDKSGSPWLRDLGSANKTTVNKRNLPIQSVGNVENLPGEGGRGVMLFPGDVLQFGASTRLYVLNGPSDFDAGAVKARLAASAASAKAVSSNSHSSAPFLKEQAIMSDMQKTLSGNEDVDDIPNQHRKLYDKIQVKKMKLANTQHEKQILGNKSVMMELSSGQAKQLESLETREDHLLRELQELEELLREQLDQSEKTSSSTKRRREEDDVDYDDSDDDFYDKTKRSHTNDDNDDNDEQEKIETIDSLISKGINLFSRLKGEKERTRGMERKILGIKRNLELAEMNRNTSDDFFFLMNDYNIAKEEHTKSLESVQSIVEEIKSLAKVLVVVHPDTIVDVDAHFIGSKMEYEAFRKERDEAFRMPPPMMPSKVMTMNPPPSRKVYGPSNLK